jgi:hypothetical protein
MLQGQSLGWAAGADFATFLNFRVADPLWFFEGSGGLVFPLLVLNSVDWVDTNQTLFAFRVERKTAPGPVLGMIDQFSFQRIHVHVLELFDFLLQAPHVEVVKPALPEARQRIVTACKDQIQLSGGRSPLAAQAARDALFQNLNYSRGRSFSRFADEQVNVLRHDDVAHQGEAVAVTHLAKNSDEHISGPNRAQKGQASIAGERNEVQMSSSIVANEFVGHRTQEKSKPRPLEPRKGRPPGKPEPVPRR